MTDREKFERWAETQPPYTTHDRAFAWSVWQAARGDLRAQQAALPEPALRLPARAGGYCGYFTEKQMREYRAGAQQAEPLGDPEWEPVGRSGVLWKFRRRDNEQQAEPPRTLTDAYASPRPTQTEPSPATPPQVVPLTEFKRMQIIGDEFPLALVDPLVIAKVDSVCLAIEKAHGIGA